MYISIPIVIFILVYCDNVFSFSLDNNIISMSADQVNSYGNPTAVTAYTCWNIHEKAALARRLGDLKHTVKFISEPSEQPQCSRKDCTVIVDLACPAVDDFLIMANKTNMYSCPYRWLILDRKTKQDGKGLTIPSQLQSLLVHPNSEVVVARETTRGHFDLQLIYKIDRKNIWLKEDYAVWNSSGIIKSDVIMESTVVRRRNLHREPLTVTFFTNEPHTETFSTEYDYKIFQGGDISILSQWGYEQIVPLFDFVNASRRNYFSNGWGYFINGSWDGLVGDMVHGRADLSGTSIFIAQHRLNHVNYLTNAVHTKVMFVFREPPLSYQNNLFLLPFNRAVWYSTAGFISLMMAVIFISAKWDNLKNKMIVKGELNDAQISKVTISDVAILIMGAITQQGSSVELRGATGRLVIYTLFLALLFLFTAYSASIVVLLQSSSKQIKTLSDLLNSRIEMGVHDTLYNRHYFMKKNSDRKEVFIQEIFVNFVCKDFVGDSEVWNRSQPKTYLRLVHESATDPVRKAIYETKVAPQGRKPNFLSLEDGVKRFQKQPFAFNMDTGLGYRVVEKFFFEHEKCGLQEIAYLPISRPWLTCSKSTPHGELFKIGLSRIREHGMSSRANSQLYSKKPVCSVRGGSFDSVNIMDVYPPLMILVYGYLIACATLAAEVLMHRFKKNDVLSRGMNGRSTKSVEVYN